MFEPSLKKTEPLTVAFKVMHGDYSTIPEGYGELYGWIGQSGWQPAGMPHAVYLTPPASVAGDEAMWELWSPVAPGPTEFGPDERGLGVKRVEGTTVASAMHKGPYDAIAPLYEQLSHWVGDQGYRIAGPPREIYYSDPDEVPPEETLTEVQMPVMPL